MGLQHDEVLRASAAWTSVWFPAHAGHADLGWLEYYLADGVGTVMQVRPGAMTAQELVPRVIAKLRDQRAAEVQWLVGPQYLPAGVGEVLRAMGASVLETVDICAHPLDRGLSSGSLPPGTKTEPVRTRADTALYERVSALAWGETVLLVLVRGTVFSCYWYTVMHETNGLSMRFCSLTALVGQGFSL
jgi:hypothetical protein